MSTYFVHTKPAGKPATALSVLKTKQSKIKQKLWPWLLELFFPPCKLIFVLTGSYVI